MYSSVTDIDSQIFIAHWSGRQTPETEYQAFYRDFRGLIAATSAKRPILRLVIVAPEVPAPNALQRHTIAEIQASIGHREVFVGLVTQSPVIRGAMNGASRRTKLHRETAHLTVTGAIDWVKLYRPELGAPLQTMLNQVTRLAA